MKLPHGGVSVGFLTGALRLLNREFGPRMMAPAEHSENIMKWLAEIQHAWKQLEPEVKPERRKRQKAK